MNKYEVYVLGMWADDMFEETEFEDVIECEGELTIERLEEYRLELAENGLHGISILVNINGEWKEGI